jgi:hypothetical protein
LLIRSLITVALLSLMHPTAGAQPARVDLADVFDQVCVGSQLDRKLIERLANLYAQHYGYKFKKLPHEKLLLMNPDVKARWGITNDKSAVIIQYGEKYDGDFLTRNCTVATEGLSFADAKRLIQENYRSRLVDEIRLDCLKFDPRLPVNLTPLIR